MEETISLKEIFEVIKKRLLLIIALMLGAALVAAIISYFVLTPTYENSSQFLVTQSNNTDMNAQLTQADVRTNVELINTYNVIITSPAVLEPVIEELNLDISSSQLAGKLQVASADNSQVVTVTATDPDPALATEIANTTVEVFQDKIPAQISPPFFFFFFLATLCGIWDLSSLTRAQTCGPCIWSSEF